MPWILDPNTGELKEKDENVDQSRDLSGSAGAGGVSSPTVGAAVSAAPAATDSGQGFTDINKYLALNSADANKLGERVASGIHGKVDEANAAIAKGQGEMEDWIRRSAPEMSEEEITRLSSDPKALLDFVNTPAPGDGRMGIFPGEGPGAPKPPKQISGGTTPPAPAQSDNVSKFIRTAAGEYTGPNAFNEVGSYNDLYKAVSGASKAGEQTKTAGGKEQLIKDVYQKPERAKTGMLGLDEALLEQSPDAIGAVNREGEAAAGLDKRRADIEAKAGEDITKTKGDVEARRQQIQKQFLDDGGVYSTLKGGIDQRTAELQKKATEDAAEARNYMDPEWLKAQGIITQTPILVGAEAASGPQKWGIDPSKIQISDAALSGMGITRDQYVDLITKNANAYNARGALSNLKPYQSIPYVENGVVKSLPVGEGPLGYLDSFSDYLSFDDPLGINAGTVATSDEYARADALKKLFGDKVDFSELSTPDKAGTVDEQPINFKYSDLLAYLNRQQAIVDALSKAPGVWRPAS